MSTGNYLEDKIIQTNRKYEKRELAMIEKIPNDFGIIRKNGKVVGARPKSRGSVDFIGSMFPDGKVIPVAIECKQTENEREFPLYIHKKAMVKNHQRKFLKGWYDKGACALYLIYFKKHKKLFLTNPDFIERMYEEEERKSIKYNEFLESEECKVVNINDYLEIAGSKNE